MRRKITRVRRIGAKSPYAGYEKQKARTGESKRIKAEIAKPIMVMYGGASTFNFDTSNNDILGYTSSAVGGGATAGDLNTTTGVFTTPATGVYRVSMTLTGTQGSSAQNEQLAIGIDKNSGTEIIISAVDVATNQTSGRTFSATFIAGLTAADTIQLFSIATSNIGAFTVEDISFSLEQMIE